MSDVDTFFSALWEDFTTLAPAAASIRAALEARGEEVLNDHVAFRTFDRGPLTLDALEPRLIELGYFRYAPYRFEQKKLRAFGYVPPRDDLPKVFCSELEVDAMPEDVQAVIDGLVAQVPEDAAASASVFHAGRLWSPVPYATWRRLAEVSEYAAWLTAHGMHANHFTVAVHRLSPELRSIPVILEFVEARGFQINEQGGRVKGSAEVLLEQGSTQADRRPTPFADGVHEVPTCYYEFALRYPQADGTLYPGFVAASADKIFESTHSGVAAS